MTQRTRAHVAGLIGAIALLACGPSSPRPIETRMFTETYAMRLSWEPAPPYAREPIVFRLTVRDKETGEPIEAGEGQVFATNSSEVNIFDSFIPAPESGTYTARLRFITSGEWALNVRFRKDSLSKVERPYSDLRMTVRNERAQ